MPLLNDLLGKGYFPEELPPCFSTTLFSGAVTAKGVSLPATQARTAKLLSFSLARWGLIRRRLSIPNPIFHYQLCKFVASNWKILSNHCEKSKLSLSNPIRDNSYGRAITRKLQHGDVLHYRATNQTHAKYLVSADLSEFYHSIYTHSIPWAIHGKAAAKANRTDKLYGNKIDTLLRNAQDGQTNGIPIGPDTFLIIAETILAAVDKELFDRLNSLEGYRYMDDYWLMVNDQAEANRALSVLQEIFLEYELRLNPRKTKVHQLPIRLEPEHIFELSNINFREASREQALDLIRYFDRLTDYIYKFPKGNVVKFGIGELSKKTTHQSNWELYQSLLCKVLLVEPGAIKQFARILIKYQEKGNDLDRSLIEKTLNIIIERLASSGCDYEVSWALWLLIAFRFNIEENAANELSKVENSIVALLALDADQKGFILSGLKKDKWQEFMRTEELYGNQWLLAYEANIQGWLTSNGGGDHVAEDTSFGFLKTHGVCFYEPIAGPVPIRKSKIVLAGPSP